MQTPWNVILNSSSISKTDNKVFIDQDELIAFHFEVCKLLIQMSSIYGNTKL